jgi:hypothetical protein
VTVGARKHARERKPKVLDMKMHDLEIALEQLIQLQCVIRDWIDPLFKFADRLRAARDELGFRYRIAARKQSYVVILPTSSSLK